MPSNKDRLYVALFARAGKKLKMPGGEDKYHWALILAPKHESPAQSGHQIDAKNTLRFVGEPPVANADWRLEVTDLAAQPTTRLLARVLVAKVCGRERLLARLRSEVPVRADVQGWNCVAWVREALETVLPDGDDVLGRRCGEGWQAARWQAARWQAARWQAVRDVAMWYVQKKHAEGRFDVSFDQNKVPTWDALRGVEMVP